MVFYFTNAFRVREMDAEQWLWCWFFGFSELLWGQIIFTIPKNIIPRQIRCCSKGVPADRGCCFCIRGGVRSRDEVKLFALSELEYQALWGREVEDGRREYQTLLGRGGEDGRREYQNLWGRGGGGKEEIRPFNRKRGRRSREGENMKKR